ncbi:MATE family efflux transporter [Lacrimispora sp. 210928-DFI.3.58]|uniref:MATE family efflux transporter n=1 Tax=Lacrimispora sp. 210928-DFI.3.58 TaxID=2883214 RepID=UPI001D06FEE3|nr:MATE family efflux transporter [Lacrimispora sp. 210928-DFI.3.58]MCB7317806.1 MATE family efflux transporter [Lacrimispora sp. 210928-DFI.3.58]
MKHITECIRNYVDGNRGRIKTALQMAWPSVLESFFVALAGMIDSMMVSSIGAYAVAAVGLTTQPKFIGLALFIATNVSVSAIVARRKGEEDRKGANQTLMLAFLFTALAGVAVSIACVALADPIIDLCGSGPDTHDSAVLYFRIIMGGMIFNILSLVINAAQRGAGKTRIAMVTNVTSNVTNIIGNYLLIGGHFGFPAMGIKGAAIATVFGTVVACALSIGSLFRRDSYVNIPFVIREKVQLTLEPVGSIVKVSSGVFLEQILMRAGFMSTAVMAAKLGTDAFAAHQVGMNVMSLTFSFGDGMQVAAVALIGQSLGAGKPELAKLYGSICQRIGNVISIVLSVTYLLGGRALYCLYFKEPHIVDMGVMIMRLIIVIAIFQLAQVIYMGCLRGAGDVLFTMTASTISVTIIRTAVSYIACFVMGLGLMGIWLGVLADQMSRFLFTTWRFKSGVWTKIKL